MKGIVLFLVIGVQLLCAQNIRSIQLFNPQTNDETPVIGFNDHLILRFDDLSNGSEVYRYTIKHFDRNWQDDGLFFSEYANGSLSGLLDDFQYSYNTLQSYTHYTLRFPNEKMQPKISGNFELVIYSTDPEKPLFTKRFYVVENGATIALNPSRTSDARNPMINQRVEVRAVSKDQSLLSNVNSASLTVVQNNNPHMTINHLRPTGVMGNTLQFQQLELSFPGNNEFYYFDNKNISIGADMVRGNEVIGGQNYTYIHPVLAFPFNYQYMPDVNGAFYFRRNDLGIERNADREADYSWVHIMLESEKVDKKIFVLGGFNEFAPKKEYQMQYDEKLQAYVAKIYLKQGFYNYVLATQDADGRLNFGEINGSFWQTENLYQGFLYYKPFGRNYDGIIGYGEFRTPIR